MKKGRKKKIYPQAGFTLIEVIVMVSLFLALLGLSTINLLNAQHKSYLSTTVDTFIADLKQQQLKAMTGDTEGTGNISNYGVHFETTSYTLFRDIYNVANTANFVVNLSGTIQVSTGFPSSQIIFQKGSGEVVNAPNTITFRDTASGEEKVVTINVYGVVEGIN